MFKLGVKGQLDPAARRRRVARGARKGGATRGTSRETEDEEDHNVLDSSFMSLDDDDDDDMRAAGENTPVAANRRVAELRGKRTPKGSVRKTPRKGASSSSSSSNSKSRLNSTAKMKKRCPGSARASSQRKTKKRRTTLPTPSRLNSSLVDEERQARSDGDGQDSDESILEAPMPSVRSPGGSDVDLSQFGSKKEESLREEEEVPQEEDDLSEREVLAEKYKAQGNRFYSEQEYGRAVEAYSCAIDVDGSNPVYFGNRAACKLMQGAFQDCIEDCERALAIDPEYMRARVRGARAYLAIGEVAQAQVHVREALEKGDSAAARHEAKEVLRQCREYERLVEEGDMLLSSERLDECEAVAKQAMQIAPSSRRIFVQQQAAKLLHAATAGSKAGTLGKSVVHGVKAELEEVVAQTTSRKEILALAKSLYQYGKTLLYCALTTEARILFTLASTLRPADDKCKRRLALIREMEARLNDGTAAFTARKFSESIQHFDAALRLDSNNAAFNGRLHFRRAASNMSLCKFSAAVQDCENALGQLPSYHKARIRMAHAYMQLNNYTAAVTELELAYKLSPTSAVARELKTARAVLEKALHKQRQRREEQRRQTFAGARPSAYASSSSTSSSRRPDPFGSSRFGQEGAGFADAGGFTRGARFQQEAKEPEERRQPPRNRQTDNFGRHTRSSAKKAAGSQRRKSIEILKSSDHYAVLGVAKKATPGTIKKAFRKKALRYHPDKNGSPTASAKFKRINEAYNVLKSPIKRKDYDRTSLFTAFRAF